MQTSGYGYNLDKAQAGQKYDIRPDTVGSYAAEGAIPFGVGVTYGTDKDNQCDIIDNAADLFLGVSLFTHTAVNGYPTGDAQYADTDTVSVLRKGAVWVEVTESVVPGDVAYVEVGGTDNGKFNKTSSGNVAVPNGKYLTSASAGALAVLEIL